MKFHCITLAVICLGLATACGASPRVEEAPARWIDVDLSSASDAQLRQALKSFAKSNRFRIQVFASNSSSGKVQDIRLYRADLAVLGDIAFNPNVLDVRFHRTMEDPKASEVEVDRVEQALITELAKNGVVVRPHEG